MLNVKKSNGTNIEVKKKEKQRHKGGTPKEEKEKWYVRYMINRRIERYAVEPCEDSDNGTSINGRERDKI